MKNYIFDVFYNTRDFISGILAPNLWWLQILSLILSALFVWGIIYIIVKTNYFEIKREEYLDMMGKGYVSKRRSLRAWRQIKKRLESQDQNDWRLAVLEADHLLNQILKMSGYLGIRLEEKLEIITSAQLANIEDVKRAHSVRDKIAQDPAFEISQKEAKEIVDVYRQSFKELNLIEE